MTEGYLADTSVFVAVEQGRRLTAAPPGDARISVATLTELFVGVHAATGAMRVLRETTLARARSFIALPHDELVAERLAELLASVRGAGRRAGAMDSIVAATALAHNLTVWTQDSDFEVLAELAPALRVHRG